MAVRQRGRMCHADDRWLWCTNELRCLLIFGLLVQLLFFPWMLWSFPPLSTSLLNIQITVVTHIFAEVKCHTPNWSRLTKNWVQRNELKVRAYKYSKCSSHFYSLGRFFIKCSWVESNGKYSNTHKIERISHVVWLCASTKANENFVEEKMRAWFVIRKCGIFEIHTNLRPSIEIHALWNDVIKENNLPHHPLLIAPKSVSRAYNNRSVEAGSPRAHSFSWSDVYCIRNNIPLRSWSGAPTGIRV